MKVVPVTCISEQGVHVLPHDQPGGTKVLDLHDSLAADFLKRGLVKPFREKRPVEFAVTEGAPEQAISARGRGRPRRTPIPEDE